MAGAGRGGFLNPFAGPLPGLWTAFLASAACGIVLLPVLRALRLGQVVRQQGPQSHLAKAGTPTSGGLMFLFGTAVAVAIWQRGQPDALLVAAMMVAFGAIGAADDLLKHRRQTSLGLRARDKLLLSTAAIVGFAWAAVRFAGLGTTVVVPGTGDEIALGAAFLPFVWLVVMGTTSGVNLSDGVDGLATGLGILAFGAFAAVTLHTGPWSLTAVSVAIAGALAAFLVFNVHPARVFMGDSGALAIGAALSAVAILSRTELYLVLVGGVFVIEALSVIAQVISFRVFGRRILRMSPLHHHFELAGWTETRIVAAFWVAGAVFAVVGVVGLR
jgi:phospho-N-acetylmuramoyl-pentapeptide-transferase